MFLGQKFYGVSIGDEVWVSRAKAPTTIPPEAA